MINIVVQNKSFICSLELYKKMQVNLHEILKLLLF